MPVSAWSAIDFPSAGTWSFKVQVEVDANSVIGIQGARLAAFEL